MSDPLLDSRGSYFVNADWSALVPAGSAEAAFGIAPEDARRRGLLPKEPGEVFPEPERFVSANLLPLSAAEPEPEPEAKEADKPADKMAPKPANKARKRRKK